MTPRLYDATWITPGRRPQRGWSRAAGTLAAAVAVIFTSACKDAFVPNLDSPTVNSATPIGFQALVTGAFGTFRGPPPGSDVGYFIAAMTSFGRDAGNFTSSDNRFDTEWLGAGTPVNNSDFYGSGGWTDEFRVVATLNTALQAIPTVSPKFSPSDAAHVTGVLNTEKALVFMYLAELRDTVGVPVANVGKTPFNQAPILCVKDVWAYVVALLDSANAELNVAPAAAPPPIVLPKGFASVVGSSGPSTTAGSFASFNRALAARANLQLAYAIARSTAGTAPTPTTPGTPDPTALARADSAVAASALYIPAALAPPTTGDFSDPNAVYFTFSGASGDIPNPLNSSIVSIATLRLLNEFVTDVASEVDTAVDKRWLNKIIVNPFQPQQAAYSGPVSSGFLVGTFSSAASPIPIVRNEELVLTRAQIQLGLGNVAGAWTYINDVRTAVGGSPPLAPSADFVTTRDALMREQRISTVFEFSEDRTISLRMYGLQTALTTTWGPLDTHATLLPIPLAEINGRGGSFTLSCP